MGTLAFILNQQALYVRVQDGWQYINVRMNSCEKFTSSFCVFFSMLGFCLLRIVQYV